MFAMYRNTCTLTMASAAFLLRCGPLCERRENIIVIVRILSGFHHVRTSSCLLPAFANVLNLVVLCAQSGTTFLTKIRSMLRGSLVNFTTLITAFNEVSSRVFKHTTLHIIAFSSCCCCCSPLSAMNSWINSCTLHCKTAAVESHMVE